MSRRIDETHCKEIVRKEASTIFKNQMIVKRSHRESNLILKSGAFLAEFLIKPNFESKKSDQFGHRVDSSIESEVYDKAQMDDEKIQKKEK